MPTPPRRRPTPTPQPPRRPQVAGLRKPGVPPSPRPRPAPQPEETDLVEDEQAQQEPQVQVPEAAVSPVTGAQEPADERVEQETQDAQASSTSPSRGTNPFTVLTIALSALAVVLIAAATFFAIQYFSVQKTLANKAMVDPAATVNVKQEVTRAVESLFSYDYSDIGKTEKAADELLTNDQVRGVYNSLLAEVKRNAAKQKIIVNSRVSRIAVIELGDESARLLVFVDQSALREGQAESNVGGGQLTVNAERVDGKWKVSELDAYEKRGQ